MKYISLIIFTWIAVAACTDEEACNQDYETSFSIEAGGEYCFPDGSLLSISEITNSYCSCDVQCIWQGEAVASGIWTAPDGQTTPTEIHQELTDQNPFWIDIASVTATTDCQPQVAEFRITVFDPATRTPTCAYVSEVNTTKYDKEASDFVEVISASISGDCLSFEVSASGCDGSSWEAFLYDSGAIAESLPEQRYIKLVLKNPEDCLAVFTRNFSFDLTPLQIQNGGVLLLNFQNTGEQLRYEY